MYYVCSERADGTYGVKDTDDDVVEFYSKSQLKEMTKKGLKIFGVHVKKGECLITVCSHFDNFKFINKSMLFKMQLAGIVNFSISNATGCLIFSFLKNVDDNYAICLRDIGVTKIGHQPCRGSCANIYLVCDNTLKKFDCYARAENVSFWFEDDVRHDIYKNIKKLFKSSYEFNPDLASELNKHEERVSKKENDDLLEKFFDFEVLGYNRATDLIVFQRWSRGEEGVFRRILLNSNLRSLDKANLAFSDKEISFTRYNGLVSDSLFDELVNFTSVLFLFTYYAGYNKPLPDWLLKLRGFSGINLNSYFSYRTNYTVFLSKYLVFLRNYLFLRDTTSISSCFGELPNVITNKFSNFIRGRGFEIFAKISPSDFKLLCDLNTDFKKKFIDDYVIDTKLIKINLDNNQRQVYNEKLSELSDYFTTWNNWDLVYKKACAYYAQGDLDILDLSLFTPLILDFHSIDYLGQLKSLFTELIKEYGLRADKLDFTMFALDCVTGEDVYCHTVGLPKCVMIQDSIIRIISMSNGGERPNANVKAKFYTVSDDGTYTRYIGSRAEYINSDGKKEYDWSFKKAWSPSVPQNSIKGCDEFVCYNRKTK